MAALATVAFYLGVIAYSAASTLFFLDLVRPGGEAARQWAPRVLLVGALLHAAHVVTGSLLSRVCPVESLHFGLSFSALCAAGVYLVVYRRANLFATGAIVAPIALTFLVGAQFVGTDPGPEGISRSLLAFHITSNVLGVGLFVVAGASGVLYLLLDRRLRSKKSMAGAAKLPSLDALDRWTHRLLVAGFPLLSFGVVTGAVFSRELSGLGNAALARSVLGYATWLVLAAVLMARRVLGVRGRRAAYGTLAGVVCVLLVVLVYALRPGDPS
jgi:ABC-type uncharacterized transport system permease subunit